jgi:fructosamine-3-kinase
MFSPKLEITILDTLKNSGIVSNKIEQIKRISGGSINQTFQLKLEKESVFIKLNQRSAFPKMFELEQMGLDLLRKHTSLKVPEVIGIGYFEDQSFLLLEYLEKGREKKGIWTSFGKGLADLHACKSDFHGLEYQNYIGSLPQPNQKKESWVEFFAESRLLFQSKMAYDRALISQQTMMQIEKLCEKLETLFPTEDASLLHGDLWSGNFLCTEGEGAALLDPAVYFGNREMDIAMSHLFGGFQAEFYQAYNEAYPLQEGWEERIELCNLYPLLVHVNLFGEAYSNRVQTALKRFL